MIMPCMNSTSACETCGTTAVVEGGSVLLGAPGAPGSTIGATLGVACWARAETAGKLQSNAAIAQSKNTKAGALKASGLLAGLEKSSLNLPVVSGIIRCSHPITTAAHLSSKLSPAVRPVDSRSGMNPASLIPRHFPTKKLRTAGLEQRPRTLPNHR